MLLFLGKSLENHWKSFCSLKNLVRLKREWNAPRSSLGQLGHNFWNMFYVYNANTGGRVVHGHRHQYKESDIKLIHDWYWYIKLLLLNSEMQVLKKYCIYYY